jgi:hypothetical protein
MTPSTAVVPVAPQRVLASDEELAIDQRVAKLSRQFGTRIVTLVQTADLKVHDVASCEAAVALRSTIGALVKEIEKGFEDEKSYYWNKHKAVCAEENKLLDQLLDRKNISSPSTIDGKLYTAILEWTAAEDQRRRDEEQRLAEAQRRDDEARAQAEASAAAQSGHHEVADAILEEAIAAPMPTVTVANVRSEVRGLRTREVWRWRFTGGPSKVKDILKETPAATVAKVMKLLPREFCAPDVATIDAYVDAMKSKASIPGIEVYKVSVPIR